MPLTTSERLLLPRITVDPTQGITTKALSGIVNLSVSRTRGILRSLADKGYCGYSANTRSRRYWRIKEPNNGPVVICSSRSIDDSLAALQSRAARADELERLLHTITNLLLNAGIDLLTLAPSEDQPKDYAE